jgi:hypothetical protein
MPLLCEWFDILRLKNEKENNYDQRVLGESCRVSWA